ncbi:MAG: tetratricopeptide repeat protein [Akkermansiaceae bacterium]|nr:tetratricopeptide repeat protein [Akkermansiaceae bacterium]
MKWIISLLLAALLLGSWVFYYSSGSAVNDFDRQIAAAQEQRDNGEDAYDDIDARIEELQGQRDGLAGDRTFKGILLTIMSAGFLGVLFVALVLPAIAHKLTHAIYDSGEMVERDPMHDAHSLLAQGNYTGAIEAFKEAAKTDPLNRLPWVEIAKIQRLQLKDPDTAITTLRAALEGQEWQMSDAAFLLFRLAELYDEDRTDRSTAAAIMMQIMEEFPETRHSANARHKMHEWGLM